MNREWVGNTHTHTKRICGKSKKCQRKRAEEINSIILYAIRFARCDQSRLHKQHRTILVTDRSHVQKLCFCLHIHTQICVDVWHAQWSLIESVIIKIIVFFARVIVYCPPSKCLVHCRDERAHTFILCEGVMLALARSRRRICVSEVCVSPALYVPASQWKMCGFLGETQNDKTNENW